MSDKQVMTTAKCFLALIALACATTEPLFAASARYLASLARLDPDLRLEQICDVEAMSRIRRDSPQFAPDRAKSDVSAHPIHKGNVLRAPGAAFRSKGQWFSLSFVCKGSDDHMRVLSFSYKIGKIIPESRWPDYGLWR
ncbi:MAG: DUF930 domain-containing protein [Xanthobacteraceae bacterium]|uniref:DUF930 domain-containing protein n=1 Tax=Pseudolabrys sp. TaxID=1960880 RepID=UPI003D0A7508